MRIGNTTHGGTVPAFYSWMRNAKAGEVFIYHHGHLAADSEAYLPTAGMFVPREPTRSLARRVREERENGNIELTQQRDESGESFYYLATRTKKRLKP